MTSFHSVSLELMRPGPLHNQLLSPLTRYMGVCGDGSPITFSIDLEHHQLLNRLESLRYHIPGASEATAVPNRLREAQLADLGSEMEEILAHIPSLNAELNRVRQSAHGDSASPHADFVHLRLVLSGSELSLLPFELAIAPQAFPGEGLRFCLEDSLPVVVTREIRSTRPSPASWCASREPRVLFVSAEPAGLSVPKAQHVLALRAALDPWIRWPGRPSARPENEREDPRPCLKSRTEIEELRLEHVQGRLKVLSNASIEDIYQACAEASYSHVHILAHGMAHAEAGEMRYGMALHKRDDPTRPDIVDGQKLAQALSAFQNGGGGRCQPLVVTLATCDSAHPGSVLVPGGSMAYDLHGAGIPWVFASQFPLTKAGSVRMAEFLYPRLLRGDDPRQVLYELRRYLNMTAQNDHDWASIVAYASMPPDFEDQVATYFEKQTRLAIDVQMHKADAIREGTAPVESKDGEHSDILSLRGAAIEEAVRITHDYLDRWEARLPAGGSLSMADRSRRTTCFGIRGTVSKRIGLLRARQGYYEAARKAFKEAREAYRRGKDQWATDKDRYHWTATQYLCLSAVLHEKPEREILTLCRCLATRDLDDPDLSLQAWAHGTLAELALLNALWNDAVRPADLVASTEEEVKRHCKEIVRIAPKDSHAVESTWRQFDCYRKGWSLDHAWPDEAWRDFVGYISAAACKALEPELSPRADGSGCAGGSA